MQYRNTCAEMLYLCIYLRWKHARVSMDFSMASSSANLLTANNGRRESANRVAMTLGKSSQTRFSMVKCEWASGVREEADASVEYNEYKTVSAEKTRVFIILLQWEGVCGHHHRLYLATTRYTVWCQRNLCESEEVGQKKNQLQPGPLVWPQCLPLPTDMLSLSAYYHHTIWSLLWVAIHR